MKIVVTGAAGMIGSNIVHGLNRAGIDDVIAVDEMTDGAKYRNLLGSSLKDYFDKDDFYKRFAKGEFGKIDAIFHEGACSDTMEHDGKFMMNTNYRCTKELLENCQLQGTRLFYASSAATYGAGSIFREDPEFESPLNVYGYSKLLMDNVMRRDLKKFSHQVVGLRYFNVYGPREQHKGHMASVAFHHFNQYKKDKKVKLFGQYGGYDAGMQARDFIYVDDVVAVNLWFLEHPEISGVFNLGSGKAQPFNDVAEAIINGFRKHAALPSMEVREMAAMGDVEYIEFPAALVGKYQCFTQADLAKLRSAGCQHRFLTVKDGVESYVKWLAAQEHV